MPSQYIELEGVRVHNLKNLHLKIRRNSLTVICGVSGSGKSSLAFDTLFAEGQRRYVETFSPYARQFLDRIERPNVDRIDGIPPAIAIRQNARNQSARSTVGTRTELLDYLRILFAKAGQVVCSDCQQPAVSLSSDQAAARLIAQANGPRGMLLFEVEAKRDQLDNLRASGFARCLLNGRTTSLDDVLKLAEIPDGSEILIVADRIKVDETAAARIAESIEQVYAEADGRCMVLVEANDALNVASLDADQFPNSTRTVDDKPWLVIKLSRHLSCPGCFREFVEPSPEVLNFQSALGACPTCEGLGQVSGMSFDKVVPDDRVSLLDGAIHPWTSPSYRHELDELLALAKEFGIPVKVPFAEVEQRHRQLIHDGIPERNFGGLVGFHRWLVKKRYKPGVSIFLNRWRSWLPCETCQGTRLTAAAGSIRLQGITISAATEMEIGELTEVVTAAIDSLSSDMAAGLCAAIQQTEARLGFLNRCGLGYLSLNRTMKTLSGGEAQRVVLTSALGSGLINTLYVLDEPTSGLHSNDTNQIIQATRALQQLGNTVLVVEHDPEFIQAADEVVEIGPGAGANGGEVVFQGSPNEMKKLGTTATGASLSQLALRDSEDKRVPSQWLEFENVNCHNVTQLSGQIPLQVICAITGVSGGGKSSLIVDALYPAICRQLGQSCSSEMDGTVQSVTGSDLIGDVCLLDQSPLARSRRSIPATTVGCFDEIRKVMAETHEAKKRNFKPGMFSFNSAAGGRCPNCEGHGVVTVEMQFLADIETTCEACAGRRFRADVLEVRYRDRSIHDILEMTVEDAFVFFNGNRKIQQRLNALRQAGLAYIRLGQSVSTLSGGESQRLKIGALLAGVPMNDDGLPAAERKKKSGNEKGTLFILDEPSTGLHMQDISSLMKCLNHLVEIGHSVIVIEHDAMVINHADYEIQIGPGPGKLGGRIVSAG
ncbi:MAG: excinuclease ABC subunit UvrA [Fuerstiella sp.]